MCVFGAGGACLRLVSKLECGHCGVEKARCRECVSPVPGHTRPLGAPASVTHDFRLWNADRPTPALVWHHAAAVLERYVVAQQSSHREYGRVALSEHPCPRHATCRTARGYEPRLDDAGTGEYRTQSFRRSAVMMLRVHVVITNEMRLIRQ